MTAHTHPFRRISRWCFEMKKILAKVLGNLSAILSRWSKHAHNYVQKNRRQTVGFAFIAIAAIFAPFGIVGVAGIAATIGGAVLAHDYKQSDKKERLSRFHLDSWLDAYEKASNLLGDGNSDRPKWVHAGRVLMLAKDLEQKITEESHRGALEVHRLKYRYFFSEVLDKPAIHFYGPSILFMEKTSKLGREEMLDKAGEQDWEVRVRLGDPYEQYEPDVDPLPEEALYAVWQAARWPDDERDPLDGLKFSREDPLMSLLFPNLAKYLLHQRLTHERNRGSKK